MSVLVKGPAECRAHIPARARVPHTLTHTHTHARTHRHAHTRARSRVSVHVLRETDETTECSKKDKSYYCELNLSMSNVP